MASKPESNYIASVHRQLPPEVYAEKMANPFRRGHPDVSYEGDRCVFEIEYKWYPKMPEVLRLYDTKKKPSLSTLQQNWLRRATLNSRPVAVIAGSPQGGIILPGISWERDFKVGGLFTPQEIANWISSQVLWDRKRLLVTRAARKKRG